MDSASLRNMFQKGINYLPFSTELSDFKVPSGLCSWFDAFFVVSCDGSLNIGFWVDSLGSFSMFTSRSFEGLTVVLVSVSIRESKKKN